jgi:hypothetical protein
MPPALAIIVNVITIFMVLSLYYVVYTQYRKRDRPQDSPMDVWRDIASNEKESAWNGFLNETIAQARIGPVGSFVSFEKTPPLMARLYKINVE